MDAPRPLDRPREGDLLPGMVAAARARLAALGAHLRAHGFQAEVIEDGLRVRNPAAPGCCADSPMVSDTIGCRPRASDGGRLWFVTSWGKSIAEADRITDAVMAIKGYLRGGRC